MKYLIYYILFFYAVVCGLTLVFFNGTGDSGDSITHYLFARYAPKHPELYLDHWAKPLFVLFASPFAQFGFIGMKLFNILITLAGLFLTYKTAVYLKMPNPILATVFLMFSPLNYILTFSGLTEPLFALFTILGIFLCVRQNYISASIIISFLPYIRSEGLIIIGVFTLYFLYKKTWRFFPYLLFGSLVYAVAGYCAGRSFLWVFTEIPYAKLSSVYGSGRLFHFVEELINVVGVPVYLLLWVGCITLILFALKRKINPEQHILLVLGFITFFVAHTLFWYLGIFSSMGLKRVFIGISPIMALIALNGFNSITNDLLPANKIFGKITSIVLVGYVLIFPFVPNPAAIHWEKDMQMMPEQKQANNVSTFLKTAKKAGALLLFNHRYLCIPLNIDYFDPNRCQQISNGSITQMKAGDILIWDNIFALSESGIKKAHLDSLPQLKHINTQRSNEGGREIIFEVYERK